jgi:DNA-binding MarR family transcriptional regulator
LWALLLLIAEHGELSTSDVTVLTSRSRPSVSRNLGSLLEAGLVWRSVNDRDPAHRARYRISTDGAAQLEQHLHDTGRPVPLALGRRRHADQEFTNDFFVRLAAHAQTASNCALYRWRARLDTAAWLRAHGLRDVHALGYGMWLEDNAAISFLLHRDHEADADSSPARVLDLYPTAGPHVPANAILVVTSTSEREYQLHRDLHTVALPTTVAATTGDRLSRASSPAEAIWTTTAGATLLRLIQVAHPSRSPSTKEGH